MAQCQVIGDVISFDGYDVARISSKLPASLRGRLEDALEDAVESETENKLTVVSEHCLDNIMNLAKAKAAAGMIELGELEQIFSQFKES